MWKRRLSILLCALLLITSLPLWAYAATPASTGEGAVALNELMRVWRAENNTSSTMGEDFYPDDVAGLYVTKEQKGAVVLVRGATEARKNELRALVQNPRALVFKSAKYSYNELAEIRDKIDTDGSFELVGWGIGEMETENAVLVEVYYGGKAAAKDYFKKYGDKVKVIEGDRFTVYMEPDMATSNEAWLRKTFPKLRSLETTETRFVFASAPEVVKTRAVLNKGGESLTLYRFKTDKDVQKANAMIKGNTLVYGGKTVYVDTLFPTTYYIHPEGKVIALYCGSDKAINRKLLETYEIAGEYGGYFDNRNVFNPPGSDPLVVDPPPESVPRPPWSIKKLLAQTDGIYIVKVQSVPVWNGRDSNPVGKYSLELMRNIQGVSKEKFSMLAYPYVMRAGRNYVLFIRNAETGSGATSVRMADWVYQSAFEIDDRGYVLPIREYGMKAPVKLETFLKGL